MRNTLSSKLGDYADLVRSGDSAMVLSDLRRFVWSQDGSIVGMERDLRIPFVANKARVDISIVALDEALAAKIFDPAGMDSATRRDLESRVRMWAYGIPNPYVAVDTDGDPCFLQWVIDGANADLVRAHFGGKFPDLQPDELLLEGAWATPNARGKRIMAEAMCRITQIGAQPHHRRAITLVEVDNIPSVRGCRSAGYEIYTRRTVRWRLGMRRIRWAATKSA